MSTKPETTAAVIALAEANMNDHALMLTSARLCLSEAKQMQERGQNAYAARRALKALSYSVGCFHGAYKKAGKLIDADYA